MNTYFTPTQRGLLDIKISLKIWRTCILAKFILSSWIWILLDQLQELGLSVVLTEKKIPVFSTAGLNFPFNISSQKLPEKIATCCLKCKFFL